ncbi:MAG TPA: STAS domain-containing protein [Chitinophagaceae bacterium]|nr:STAS domain-containing protein [Chitinophagaceae bacterium]HMZ46468.1 STAS domain-containing protein [Chitinophagaceae bacterium]HNE93296.1 STAS domain-containing protein [Chitinophagaceae bacterium]HNF30708.1 STAS domain-containing protein [Chitinophagaceae bacterium]HNJ57730.1 STAS domain-containing protein [Chitinophagaceae bacterium]
MNFKLDTKEKFTSILIEEIDINANKAENLAAVCMPYLNNSVKNIILNLSNVVTIQEDATTILLKLQQIFYEKNASFVICCLQNAVENSLENYEVLEFLNVTPTESEAWDIVQMEEIERELLDSEDIEFEA